MLQRVLPAPLSDVAVTAEVLDVAFVVPLSGPAGMFGPSCEACGQLAVDELNAEHGVLGREVRLRAVDGGQAPEVVAAEVDSLISMGSVQAVTGWHISAVREAVAPKTVDRVPYVYTPLYEGGERTPGVFLTGETPSRQVLPAMRWMAAELGVRSWFIVGDDYVWPRASARAVRRHAADCGAEIRDEVFVTLGTEDFGPSLRRVERSRAQGVLMFLVGSDAVRFNRDFRKKGLDEVCVRLSPLMDENILLGTGAISTRDLYAAAGYFETLATADSLDFGLRYSRRFGANAPMLNSLGESCYEGVTLLSRLAEQAGRLELPRMCGAADSLAYDGPRGSVRMQSNHLIQRIYLARADGLEFDVLAALTAGA
ncbi:MAG: ABC transporter substrate-binding protein [Pseudonocardiaceae bacterium]|nr:ABC transporter substrate-binding protein [Pseudonocardiaceae bacterium]